MSLCAAPITGRGFMAATLDSIDCQAEAIGAFGYQALAAPGSPISLALSSLLTIFFAIIGIRMLMGETPNFGSLMGIALKLGIVLALATSWQAYRVVAYETVIRGPAEIASTISKQAVLPGSDAMDLKSRLQQVDNGIVTFVAMGSGQLDNITESQRDDPIAKVQFPISDGLIQGLGRTVFVSSVIAGQGLSRLLGGIFLALAPLFAGLLLFVGTRDFFWGWVRILIAVSLGSLITALVLAVELAILEPWLFNVLSLRTAKYATPNAAFELLAISLAFGFIMAGGLFIAVRLAFSPAVSGWVVQNFERASHTLSSAHFFGGRQQQLNLNDQSNSENRSRAAIIADSIVNNDRRTIGGGDRATMMASQLLNQTIARQQLATAGQDPTPLGETYRARGSNGTSNIRRTVSRVSAAAVRRSAI
jgi:type IV secretion system protein VirB6